MHVPSLSLCAGRWRVTHSHQVDELVGVLNASNITSTTEVVVAPPSVYLQGVSQNLRGDVKVYMMTT